MTDLLTDALAALQATVADLTADELLRTTPCAPWTVGQVLAHAVADQHVWAATVGTAAPPGYNPFDPPQEPDGGVAAAVEGAVATATSTWAGLGDRETLPTPLPPVPTLPRGLAEGAAALDAAVHAWDVAVATGRPSPLTPALAERLRPAAEATAEALRGFAYAPALPPVDGEDQAASLLRYLGRDPGWS